VSAPLALPSGQTQYNITGGTRPGGGTNLFHSFGNFNVPENNIANFLNNTGLPTSNILGRVTGGNLSNIFGTIQTTGFGNANLFLMNPAGFLFGPNATVNVGGMVSFSGADYLRLADGVRFNAVPKASADALLSAAPVAAFGFLGSNPGAIAVQGSQLTVAPGTGISLVGGNITVQDGATLRAPQGTIALVSVGKPSNPHAAGEVVIAGSGPGTGYTPTGFKSLGSINLSEGSTISVSRAPNAEIDGPATVLIRAGKLVMDDASITAFVANFEFPSIIAGGTVDVTAEHVTLSNHSTVDVEVGPALGGRNSGITAPRITFNVGTFSATDSAILAPSVENELGGGGAVTIQGLHGAGTFARSVSLLNTEINTTGTVSATHAGPILISADNNVLKQSTLDATSEALGGGITLTSTGKLDIQDSSLDATAFFGQGGRVNLLGGKEIVLTNTPVFAGGGFEGGGSVTMAAPFISLSDSPVNASAPGGTGGTISLTGTKAVSLTNGSVLFASGGLFGPGGSIQINGGAQFLSQQSRILAPSGTIQLKANKVMLTDSLVTTSASRPEANAGTITVDAKNTTLNNSQILSTATNGHGGTIDITTKALHRDSNSVIDASSQFGTDGTVTINGVVKP